MTIIHRLEVLPGVALAAQRLDVRYALAASQGQGNDLVRGEERISIATTQAHVAVLLAKSLEVLDSKIALRV